MSCTDQMMWHGGRTTTLLPENAASPAAGWCWSNLLLRESCFALEETRRDEQMISEVVVVSKSKILEPLAAHVKDADVIPHQSQIESPIVPR